MATAKVGIRIHLVDTNDVRSVMFDETMLICFACSFVREKFLPSSNKDGSANEYGLFKPDEDSPQWLNVGRTIKDYGLCDGDTLQYKRKVAHYAVALPDGTTLKIKLNNSRTVAENVKTACSEAKLANDCEYSFEAPCLPSTKSTKKQDGKARNIKRSSSSAKNVWLKANKTFAEQGVDENCVLTLKKKFRIIDPSISPGDSTTLNAIYAQCRDDIISGVHPCTEDQAIQLAALQCYLRFGKNKPLSIKIAELLPLDYAAGKDTEQSVLSAHSKLNAMTEAECKVFYIQLCRSLHTYGATYFLVDEKQKSKKKLVPVLLGFRASEIIRVDKVTKQVVTTWPLQTIRRWMGTEDFFKIDFGAASSQLNYAVQTTEGREISEFLSELTDAVEKTKKDKTGNKKDGDRDISTRNDVENTEPLLQTVEHGDTTCNTEDDLDSGPFDDAQFSNYGCPSSPAECPSPKIRECPSPRIMDCPSPMPGTAPEARDLLPVTASSELLNINSAPQCISPNPEGQRTILQPLQITAESTLGPIAYSDLPSSLGMGYLTLPHMKSTSKTGKEPEPAEEVQRLHMHVLKLQLELQMAMDNVKYAEQRAEFAERKASLAEERAKRTEESFRLSWHMTNQ